MLLKTENTIKRLKMKTLLIYHWATFIEATDAEDRNLTSVEFFVKYIRTS